LRKRNVKTVDEEYYRNVRNKEGSNGEWKKGRERRKKEGNGSRYCFLVSGD
jgi:hypothetical protein